MAVLSRIAAVSLVVTTSCYSPELRDCAVSCASSSDCAPDQVCGTDRVCASPEIAGRCASRTSDAAVDTPGDAAADARSDAAPIDAAIDAPAQLALQIEISNRGAVTVAGIGTCPFTAPLHICTFAMPPGVLAQLVAEPDPDYRFDKWEAGPCVGEDETCAFVPTLPVTSVKAKFRPD